jgi:uncharacterized phiE125 gp8 family phage protein
MTLTADIRRSTVVTTAATSFPVSREEVKRWLRETSDDFNTDIDNAIRDAVQTIEADNSMALMSQTLTMKLDCFPSHAIELERWPVQSITSISYIDVDGDSQTLSSSLYTATLQGAPARVAPSYGNTWPSTRALRGETVTIVYLAGYTSAAAVPETLKQCVRYLVEMDFRKHRDFDEIYHVKRRLAAWRA